MSIEVANESGVDVDANRLVELSRFVLDRMRVHPQAELSLLLVDVTAMEQLHVQWMDEAGPTDVMAFPMDELRPGARRCRARAGSAGRHRALPHGGRAAGCAGRSPDRRRARPALHPRDPAPARLRPRRARRQGRDVRPPGRDARGLARTTRPEPMTSSDVWALVLAAVLVLLAALFAAADAALSRVSRSRVEELAATAGAVRRLLPRWSRTLRSASTPCCSCAPSARPARSSS